MQLTFADLARYRGLVTMVDGSFDPLHEGHIRYLHQARAFGYPLLVNICPDAVTATKHPVVLPAAQRAVVLDALELVQYVHASERLTPAVLQELQPAIYCKGGDWRGRLPLEQEAICEALNIRIEYTDPPTNSSTALLQRLQPDVDAFERLVQSQIPATTPWTPTEAVPYDFESRKLAEGIHPQLVKKYLKPTRLLDVGCGPHAAFVQLLRALRVRAFGIDLRLAQKFDPPIAEEQDLLSRSFDVWLQYDVVVCREMLEHLTIRQIRAAVSRLCALSSKFVYITTRYAKHPAHFLSVDTSDELDPTHRTMLNKDFLRTLFVLEGFKRRADLEQKLDWRGLGRCLIYERA